ncbi:chloramphenicol acetyltransferase [Dokdonia pacifica]|uniref:Chloramphenicol O-acetyltransferase type A n=1 Tax=Dokdonia pacifica TaxID=1627892 RepID=A0A238WJ05_9FLAO|nr:chloramphenicol acetyltransferase [Dokdonia pacifica]GGG21383.1 chloramphenicol acetyltransferase [Dokdonia pacifica]SNR46214.1 chloramphenicol O-acetyltransferase type A [Dokdonia pacifica]
MKTIDLSTWKRKQHFDFFTQFEEPFFGVTVSVDVTKAMRVAKEKGYSFFSYYLHKCVLASNQIENFKYRITPDNQVVLYDHIGASATLMRKNETFAFSDIPYAEDFNEFVTSLQKEIERIQESDTLFPPENPENVIHYSAIPWLNFSSITHARMFKAKGSEPKISFGKVTTQSEKKTMPVAIYVHHGLIDGLHVSRFIDVFQNLLNA